MEICQTISDWFPYSVLEDHADVPEYLSCNAKNDEVFITYFFLLSSGKLSLLFFEILHVFSIAMSE